MDRPPCRLLVALALAALIPVTASADYRESFSQGIRAYRASNWRATAVLMQQALQQQPRETGRVQITGNETVPYLPSFYLGDALLRQGDCAGALIAFERARQTAAANNRGWLARMDLARETCGKGGPPARPPDAAPAIAEAAKAVAEAIAVRDRMNKLKEREFGAEAMAAGSADSSAGAASLDAAQARLARARQANDVQDAREAERLAGGAVGQFKDAEVRIEEAIKRLSEAAATAKEAAAKEAAKEPPKDPGKDPAKEAAKVKPPTPDPGEAARQQRLQNAARTASAALRQAQQVASGYQTASGGQPRSKALQDAMAELNSVAEVVSRGMKASEGELTTAAGAANRISALFERERDAALAKDLGEAARAAETLLTSADGSLKTLRGLAQSSAGRPAALDSAALAPHERELARLRARLSEASTRDREGLRRTLVSARSLDERLSELVRTSAQQAATDSGVPADLLQGARAFFAGRYQDAVTQLEALELPRDAASGVRLQAHLLRAAALFSVWALDREQDDQRRRAAAAAVAECHRLAPLFQPDATVFSPRFVRFYQSVK